jgi:hypothetical protein
LHGSIAIILFAAYYRAFNRSEIGTGFPVIAVYAKTGDFFLL